MKVLLDTDIGSDIDDAVALAYLLANKDCELMGITTVTGEPEKRAALASVLCRAAGQRIPIHPGAESPLLTAQRQARAQQAAALEKWPHQTGFPRGEAVTFLRQTIMAHPNEVVLLTIGPLTNIALLFAMDPAIPRLLKGMVSMCGLFSSPVQGWGPVEWNASLDPHAAAIVYRQSPPWHRTVGLDVTTRVVLGMQEFTRRFQHPLLRPVLDFAEAWFRHKDRVVFHDPLAAAVIFDQTLCRFARGTVEVELEDQGRAGATRWTPDDSAGRHEVGLGVDGERFFDRYFSVFT